MSDEQGRPFDTGVQGWLDESAAAPPGDFADVVRRARALPGAQLSAQDVEEAEGLPTDDAELQARLNFGSLEDFLDAAAAFVAEQGAGEPPPMRSAALPRRRSWVPVVGAVAAVAAAMVLWVGVRSWNEAGVEQESSPASEAIDRTQPEATSSAALQAGRPRELEGERDAGAQLVPEVEASPEPGPQVEPEGDTGGADHTPRRPKRSTAELDALARDAWKAGDLERARRLFERVVARGGRGQRADIAYGDLFTLARRQGEDARLRRYWKQYVQRFPKGRYVDDARAGLCRTSRADKQARCWSRYLADRPNGTFRADAEAALRGL